MRRKGMVRSDNLCGRRARKRSALMMLISLCRVFLLATCCFIKYQVSEQPRVSLKTSLHSVVSVRTTGFVATELLWFETKLLGPFPWP